MIQPDGDPASGPGSGDGGTGLGQDGGGGDAARPEPGPDASTAVDAGSTIDAAADGDAGPLPPPHEVVINEVVVSPEQDWSNSDGSGTPYRVPGRGRVSGRDQYVELLNLSDETIDLSGWSLHAVDSTPSTTSFADTEATLVASSGSSLRRLLPGARLVVGNPDGFLSTDVYLQLFDGLHEEPVDTVEIGGGDEAHDYAGDGPRNGAPSADRNGYARGAFEEAIARPAGSASPDDIDWVAMIATPGEPNLPFDPGDDTTPPSLSDSVEGATLPITGPFWVELDESIGGASVYQPGVVTMTADGIEVGLDPVYSVQLGGGDPDAPDKRLIVHPIGRLPFSADIEIIVAGGEGGLTDRAGNPLASDIVVGFQTEGAPSGPAAVVLNEICVTAMRDWSDSHGGDDLPFSATPGDGAIDTEDEWVELLSRADSVLNLEDWTLAIYNGPTAYGDPLTEATFVDALIVGLGDSIRDVEPGDRVVIGNPSGTMSRNTFLALRDDDGVLVDHVEIGGTSVSNDRGGDGIDNGAPSPGEDGDVDPALVFEEPEGSLHFPDEVIARYPDGQDSDDDVSDFVHAEATLGASNGP